MRISYLSALLAFSLGMSSFAPMAGAASTVNPTLQDDSIATTKLLQALSAGYPTRFTAEENVAITVITDEYNGGFLGEFVTTVLTDARTFGGEGSLSLQYSEGTTRESIEMDLLYRMIGSTLYGNLTSLMGSGEDFSFLMQELQPYMQQWYSQDLPSEFVDMIWESLASDNGFLGAWNEIKDALRTLALQQGATDQERQQIEDVISKLESGDMFQVRELFRPAGSQSQRYNVVIRMEQFIQILDSIFGDDDAYQSDRAEVLRQLRSINIGMRFEVSDATGQVTKAQFIGLYRNPDLNPYPFDPRMIIVGARANILPANTSSIVAPADSTPFQDIMAQITLMGEVILSNYQDRFLR